ncbi:MAG: ATPase [Nitrospirae bacterium CG_4_10_14_0_8_um_filter_41_23]|nr:MAG: ATPase [Nitrospirae bacterium CG11_big_fil_rev_8_21_14_0_20_41_14]PIV44669.1 MAG: ATPase [Nitrospirae bacterium CG02_land_8_20_14_3_00_41_53]PIW86380.1 MAG: ATPase [Nitrospirae bacterium CG_4_8_14_3_um_filter_41_47]PIY87836.1 MAG: ATPase [Nitrospirae bacterium CG_4_10_14_0_8_um_filter_41_23]PJA81189.1 MAG: ATPase [Nitrospirae bacterium CG_4_9_14_3_um_filter_41_27]
MALTGLLETSLKLILFGGKGGVGKTTCASIAGLYLANNNKNTLLISTDPAHSLADSMGKEIGDEIKQIEGVDKLSALEISAEKALSGFKIEYDAELRRLFDTSTYLDKEDIDSIIALPIPGIDEVMGFKTILNLIEEGKFDKYIVDTAPTGHALRLLTFPELLDDWIKVLAKMRWKYRYMVTSFAGKYKPDSADDFLMSMKKTVKKIEGLLKDQSRCEFIIVTIPEDMAIKETERLIGSLNQYGMKVKQLIINNVIPDGSRCPFCQARREGQDRYIGDIRNKFSNLKITIVPLQPHEVKGVDALRNLGSIVFAA